MPDYGFERAVVKELEREGFTCHRQLNGFLVPNFRDKMELYDEIKSTLEEGYFLCLISKEFDSDWWETQALYSAIKINKTKVFPVIVDDIPMSDIPWALRDIQCLDVGDIENPEEKVQAIVKGFIRFDLSNQKNISQDED